MKTLFFIKQIFKRFPFLVIANTFLLLMVSLIDAISVVSLIAVIDLFLKQSHQATSPITQKIIAALEFVGLPATINWMLTIFIIFNVLKTCFQIIAYYSIFKTKYAALRDLMVGTIKDFFKARWYFFSSGKQGTLLNTFTREINVIGEAFGVIARYFSAIIQTIVFLFIPFYLSWQLTSVVMIVALIFASPFLLLGKVSYRLGKLNTSTANDLSKVIHEGLSSVKIILGFGNQHKTVKDLDQTYCAHSQASIKSQTLSSAMPLVYYPLGLVVLIIGLFISRKISLPLSETAVLFYSISRVIPSIGQIAGYKASLDNFAPSYEQIIKLRNHAKDLKQLSGSKIFTGFDKKITVENLSFAYPNHRPVIKDINMVIPKGKMIAVVGESGVGKSTLIDMLMKFNEPISGNILFDDVNLQDFDVNSYRHRLGYVPQDSILFNTTVLNNLLWANESATKDEIEDACLKANAQDFIRKLPEGYSTLVGDRGVRLSGGQVQRIALARAMLRKPEILILDEATSALDTYSERLIQHAIDNIANETTVIVIAHRLSTIKNADFIYVLKNGRIVEEGNYQELMQKTGHFNNMVKHQRLEEGLQVKI